MKNALRWIGRGFMWLCTAVVVLGGLVYVVGQIVGIPVQPTYETVAHAALPGEQQPAPPLPPADSARLGENARRAAPADSAAPVQNVIFLIGDGMGLSMLSTVDALAERRLAMGRMPVTGLVRTHSLTGPISDSGAGATAMATGFKTTNYTIGMTPDGRERLSILEAAARQGMATGVVTTSYLTDATPAGFTAHLPSRSNYAAIARQMIGGRADVLLGGGQPPVFTDSLRRVARQQGFAVDSSLKALARAPARPSGSAARWLGLFPEREGRFDEMHGPPLARMVEAAIRRLHQQPGEGFFLVAEQEGTDAAAHINRLEDTRRYVRELDRAVERALRFAARAGSTLVVVTADHDTGGLHITEGKYETGRVTARWTNFGHTATWVPLLAYGPGAQQFTGIQENTDLPVTMARLLGLEAFLGGGRQTTVAPGARAPQGHDTRPVACAPGDWRR